MVEKIFAEVWNENSKAKYEKFEVCLTKLKKEGLSESSQKTLAAQLIAKRDTVGLRHYSDYASQTREAV